MPSIIFSNHFTSYFWPIIHKSLFIIENIFFFLQHLGQQEIDTVRQAILKTWPKEIHKEKMGTPDNSLPVNCYQFKLNGKPWKSTGDKMDNSITCRKLAARILHDLYNLGWKVCNVFKHMS